MTRKDYRKSALGGTSSSQLSVIFSLATLLLSTATSSAASPHRRRAARPGSSSVASRESVLEYFLLEELYPRAFVGNIITEYGLDRRYPPSVITQLRFGFLTHSKLTSMQLSGSYVFLQRSTVNSSPGQLGPKPMALTLKCLIPTLNTDCNLITLS